MKIPTHYKGTIYVKWNIEHGFIHFTEHKDAANGFVVIGSLDVDVPLSDGRNAAVDSLRDMIEKERAEARHRINILEGRIQSLLALEVSE